PFGQIPLLEVNGKPLPQSFAICRYLAREFGFVGDSPFEAAWVDAIADQWSDYFNEIKTALFSYVGFVKGDKEQMKKDIAEPARDKFFPLLEKIAKDNHSNGHFVGASLTWVDLLIAEHVSVLLKYMPGFLESYPSVLATVKSTMPSYKLTYFDARGRAEVARQLFHLAGIPYEDIRIQRPDWPALKAKTPFGQIPLLEVDGQPLPQSFAIFRYLAKEFGFAGGSPFEAAWVDAIADQQKDYLSEIRPALMVYLGMAQGDKEQLVKDVAIPARDKFFTLLEKIAKDNGSNGHFVGHSLTWIDLMLADHVSVLLKHLPGFLDGYPTVLATVKKIESIPKLKEWIDKRPDTMF
ncbi:hypothetical protein PENTCL1PPCAC_15471, partial [Pristionchus entomophagus]